MKADGGEKTSRRIEVEGLNFERAGELLICFHCTGWEVR